MNKSDLFNLHFKFYKYIKEKALSLEGRSSKEFKEYQEDQSYYSERTYHSSSEQELINSINNSQIIYVSDFHTFEQHSKNLIRVMRQLLKNRKKFTLGLEMIAHENQSILNAYLEGNITEIEFLEQINYLQSWNFPWGNYREIFQIAKQENIPIIGLNTTGTLTERDSFASELIHKELLKDKQRPFLLLYGELHLMPNKIPRMVKLKLSGKLRQTIIHQNNDVIYWKMRKKDNVQRIIKFSDSEFSLQSSPPWVKYESMVYWIENVHDDPDFDLHEHIIETGLKTIGEQAHDNLMMLLQDLKQTLDLKFISEEGLENFNLYDHTKLEYLENLIEEIPHKKTNSFYEYLLTSNSTFCIAEKNILYCPDYSINRLAYTAGIFLIKNIYDHFKKNEKSILSASSPDITFSYFFMQAFFGFLSSKILNPYRKCDLYLDLIEKSKSLRKNSYDAKSIQLALSIIDLNQTIAKALYRTTLQRRYEVAKYIGHFFAEYFFESRNTQTPLEIKLLIENDFFSMITSNNIQQSFENIKEQLLGSHPYQTQRKRIF